MGRPSAVGAEIARRGDQPFAKMMLPQAVDDHPRRQRIGRIDDPAGQGQPPPLVAGQRARASRGFVQRELHRHNPQSPRRHHIARLHGIAAVEPPGLGRIGRENAGINLGGRREAVQVAFRAWSARRAMRRPAPAHRLVNPPDRQPPRASDRRRTAGDRRRWPPPANRRFLRQLRSCIPAAGGRHIALRDRGPSERRRSAPAAANSSSTQPRPGSAEIQLRLLPIWPSLMCSSL